MTIDWENYRILLSYKLHFYGLRHLKRVRPSAVCFLRIFTVFATFYLNGKASKGSLFMIYDILVIFSDSLVADSQQISEEIEKEKDNEASRKEKTTRRY